MRSAMLSATALALMLSTFASGAAMAAEMMTAKERLSDKASDEQRVDNCGVPLERRGPVPRPDCAPKGQSLGDRGPGDSSMIDALGEQIDDHDAGDDEGEA